MADKLTHGMIMKILDYCYDKAVNGLPGFGTVEELAENYMKRDGTITSNANKLIDWQIAKASTSGFITGLGGIITLPVAVPANIASVLYVQIRMAAAIAYMGGYDVRSDQVKTFVYLCLCGSAIVDLLKDIGIQIGSKLAVSAINKISGAALTKINQAIGFRLLTKFGQKGIVNLGKAVPFLGGVIGATIDGIATNTIGKTAIKIFLHVPRQAER